MTNAGFLITRTPRPNRRDWEAYTAFCARHGLPRITVTKAAYWKVECDAGTLYTGRFDDATLAALEETARPFLAHAPSKAPRIKAIPGRIIVYGLTRDDARRLARRIVDRFPPLATYTQPISVAPPPPSSRPAHLTSAAYRLIDGTRSNVVDLARYRKRRRPHDTDLFGLPRRTPPTDRGPA